MNLNEILDIPGIVIRKIPFDREYRYSSTEKRVKEWKAQGGKTEIVKYGKTEREIMIEHKTFSHGGKYLITFAFSQDSSVRFDFKTCGVGNTIEEAYADFHNKSGIAQ